MLKVVGASWEKTRLTSIMLGAVTVIAIFAIFFFEVPLDHNDGNYAATVYWSKQAGYSFKFWGQGNSPEAIKPGAARAYYRPDMKRTGWATLEVQTESQYPDWVQAHAAGLLEGSLCWQLIFWHWQNTVAFICESKREFCTQVRSFLQENNNRIREEAAHKSKTDPLWHQVFLFYAQLDGLETGWRYGVARSRRKKEIDIPSIDFLWMNAVSDLKDLEYKFNLTNDFIKPLSISILKLLKSENRPKFLIAHTSGGYYTEMLRMQKKYSFGFHLTGDNRSVLVPGQSIMFTSYPAALHSQDDFYNIRGQSKFLIYGTSIRNFNYSLWNNTDPHKLLMGPRVMAANRLSLNGSHWGDTVAANNGGTGAKQWVLLRQYDQSLRMWLVEQIPGKTLVQDQTETLQSKGFWASWGLPYNEELIEEIGYKEASEQIEVKEYFDKVKLLLESGQSNITDIKSMLGLMRGPEMAIIGRNDIHGTNIIDLPKLNFSVSDDFLNPEIQLNYTTYLDMIINQTASVEELNVNNSKDQGKVLSVREMKASAGNEPESSENDYNESFLDQVRLRNGGIMQKKLHGNIDLKITMEDGTFQATAGPPYIEGEDAMFQIEPFQWSKSLFKDVPHNGQSDIWQFDAVQAQWVWN